MRFKNLKISRKFRVFLIILAILIIIFSLLRFFVFRKAVILPVLLSAVDYYLFLAEKCANRMLILMDSPVVLKDHLALLDNEPVEGFETIFTYGLPVLIFLLLIWLIRIRVWKRVLFSVLLLLTAFFFTSLTNAISANYSINEVNIDAVRAIPHSIGYLFLFSVMLLWYFNNKKYVVNTLMKWAASLRIPLEMNFVEKKLSELFIVFLVYIIFISFAASFSNFDLWIKFIVNSSRKLLEFFGKDAVADNNFLRGGRGSVFVIKPCLGLMTLFLFSAVVFLTGDDIKKRIIYILSGILFLNLINILRIIILFVHLQQYGNRDLTINLHEKLNFVVYAFVFVLWVIWFECFTDGRKRIKSIASRQEK